MNLWLDLENWNLKGEESLIIWLDDELKRENYNGKINFILTGDVGISELNETYLNHKGSTDVISFNLELITFSIMSPETPEIFFTSPLSKKI